MKKLEISNKKAEIDFINSLKKVESNSILRIFMDSEEIKAANRLVKKGLIYKTLSDTIRPVTQFSI